MSQLNAVDLSAQMEARLVDFAVDVNHVRDSSLAAACRSLWSGTDDPSGRLVSDIWVEAAFGAEASGDTLGALAAAGRFSQSLADQLDRTGQAPRARPLYTHQRDAILAARQDAGAGGARPSLVVTAGTGAGKTESFLLPILDDLWSTPRMVGEQGARCLILYPMNALVNDQVERLDAWLEGQNRVTYFHFTGETPEDAGIANRLGIRIDSQKPARMRTRQEARGLETSGGVKIDLSQQERGPQPDILITNYSMLEYMLCRPQDAIFFGAALSALVLDEAHLYTGTLAAEVTLLLRRVFERCGRRPEQILQIATSATIGSGAPGELEEFAGTLFSKDPDHIQVIRGRYQRKPLPDVAPPNATQPAQASRDALLAWPTGQTVVYDPASGKSELARDAALCARIADALPSLVAWSAVDEALPAATDAPARLLYDTLSRAPILRALEEILWVKRRLPLPELAAELFGDRSVESLRAAAQLLSLGANARLDLVSYPLAPHRLHVLARACDGLFVCLNAACSGPSALKMPSAPQQLGALAAGGANRCAWCDGRLLAIHRCRQCGEWLLAGDQNNGGRLEPSVSESSRHRRLFQLAAPAKASAGVQTRIDSTTGLLGAGSLAVTLQTECPCCGSDAGEIVPFQINAGLLLSILSETLLVGVPPLGDARQAFLPAGGRRVLAFSDSRSEAARLGPRLTRQHELQLMRAALARAIDASPGGDLDYIDSLVTEIAFYGQQLAVSKSDKMRIMAQAKLDQLRSEYATAQAGGSVEEWCNLLAKSTLAQQLLDSEGADSHRADAWSRQPQDCWDGNAQAVRQGLMARLGREIARAARRQNSAETLGLVEVVYPGAGALRLPDAFLGALPDASSRKALEQCAPDLFAALLDSARTDGAVTLGDETLDEQYQEERQIIGKWCSEKEEFGAGVFRFVGNTPRQIRRSFARRVLLAAGVAEAALSDGELDRELLRAVHRTLLDSANCGAVSWLEADCRYTPGGNVQAWRIVLPRLALRKPAALFRCPKTGYLWPRDVLGCAPALGNDSLAPVEIDALPNDTRVGRLRAELLTSPVFEIGLWAEEHSAQLAPEENKRLQDLFKLGARNILSSTTTLELGIDIGGLNAVLMSNVPPGKANYLQRAGRAGRRADGSSIVVTNARTRPYDRAVFREFGKYLDKPLIRPRVLLERERIALRHLHSFLLGEFFRRVHAEGKHVGAMRAFGNMGQFCFQPMPEYWRQGPQPPQFALPPPPSAPAAPTAWWNPASSAGGYRAHFRDFLLWARDEGQTTLGASLRRLLQGTPALDRLADWTGCFDTALQLFDEGVARWQRDYDRLLADWQATIVADSVGAGAARARANRIRYQMEAFYNQTVIAALADAQFLPRYGFPIGTQSLRVVAPDKDRPNRVREEDMYRLSRGGVQALREYVPGSQLVAKGRLITSHGLLKHWTGADMNTPIGIEGLYGECSKSHLSYSLAGPLDRCRVCDEPITDAQQLLIPEHGYSTAAWDKPKLSSDTERVGRLDRATVVFRDARHLTRCDSFGGVPGLTAYYREDGEIVTLNSGENERGFAICLHCGYADSELRNAAGTGAVGLPATFARHARLDDSTDRFPCWQRVPLPQVRRAVTLAARETTDILMLDFEACLGSKATDKALAQTLALALRIAGARLLSLDGREISSMPAPSVTSGVTYGAVVFDNVPGGAGHVYELLQRGREWLEEAQDVLWVSQEHHRCCETACLDCLLTFDAQDAMEQGLLVRRKAKQALDNLLTAV